jgi:hypothetical protein
MLNFVAWSCCICTFLLYEITCKCDAIIDNQAPAVTISFVKAFDLGTIRSGVSYSFKL